jgi:hypothetical protein
MTFLPYPRRAFLLILTVVFLATMAGCTPPPEKNALSVDSGKETLSQAEKSLGIKVESLRLSAAGYIIDFRYKTIDPEKAAVLFSREKKPYLLDEATGAVFAVPAPAKVGPLRQTTNKPVAGQTYFMLFGNAGKLVKAGDKVTIIFGKYRIEHLTVE